eukprot:TRINITY_DN2018_c0_g1_i1.p1 TRINITY_DN2018_c0_g1~~TRINITY_DN2018_c0_g1_i1.p1  ORF type:complete len:188 (+),score=85.79 TRINITY_DN2018_c0_g1_i1:86-565(+)
MARTVTVPASQFKSEKDPAFLEFQSTATIENLYEFQVKNVAQYNVELRKLADLKVNDKVKSIFEVMKSKLIVPDATTLEILARSCEPDNHRRAIAYFDEVIKFEMDPTPETYKSLAAVFKAAKQEKAATLLAQMAKDEDRFASDRFNELVAEFHKLAKQ